MSEGPEGPVRRVEIQTGLSDGLAVEILSGVKEGDRIVERPPREIK
jgi:multidrug efflux pump subunit AcrA (membrane-fusion protein)